MTVTAGSFMLGSDLLIPDTRSGCGSGYVIDRNSIRPGIFIREKRGRADLPVPRTSSHSGACG
jgi:hypothetical protein